MFQTGTSFLTDNGIITELSKFWFKAKLKGMWRLWYKSVDFSMCLCIGVFAFYCNGFFFNFKICFFLDFQNFTITLIPPVHVFCVWSYGNAYFSITDSKNPKITISFIILITCKTLWLCCRLVIYYLFFSKWRLSSLLCTMGICARASKTQVGAMGWKFTELFSGSPSHFLIIVSVQITFSLSTVVM